MNPSRASNAPARCRAGATLLLSAVVLGALPLDTAESGTAVATASATVVEAVKVLEVLGTPVSLSAVLAALDAPAGPGTGSALIRLIVPAPTGLAAAASPFAESSIALAADGLPAAFASFAASSGVLQSGLAAAVTLARPEDAQQPASVTVAFN